MTYLAKMSTRYLTSSPGTNPSRRSPRIKIKTLQANLEIVQQFHDVENLYNVAITQALNHNIIRSLPRELRPSFNDQFQTFRKQNPNNVRTSARFEFLANFVNEIERNY